jgi:hypothetical protein
MIPLRRVRRLPERTAQERAARDGANDGGHRAGNGAGLCRGLQVAGKRFVLLRQETWGQVAQWKWICKGILKKHFVMGTSQNLRGLFPSHGGAIDGSPQRKLWDRSKSEKLRSSERK